ncbi:MAG TPA: serine/threonine-protein kinase [Terriglobales bacterium]|nr:serine/threonine-protein kinase [Terriglobales bacterium]
MGTAPAIGSTISHYRITEKLGAGGMGVVYRAGDMNLQRDMALKFLPDELAADPGARKRLVKEAQAASRLNHPNIATIYEVDESHGTPFIAMELVNGESLKDVLRRGPLPPQKLLDIARQIAEGLHEAHQGGILHRDIKPGNIMVDTKGRVKILDFGLAALTGQGASPANRKKTSSPGRPPSGAPAAPCLTCPPSNCGARPPTSAATSLPSAPCSTSA